VFIDDDGPVGRDLDRSATLVLTRARVYVRVGRRGALLTSLRPERGRGPLGPYVDVVAGRRGLTDYVMFEHDGTPPHSIRARRRKTLRFIWHGRVVFYKRVRHPGTKGSRFLSRALRDLR
jgi:hypothetical protein